MKSRFVFLPFVVAALTVVLQGQVPVTDDAFTSSGAPSANYGLSLGLVVQSPTATGLMTSPAEMSGFTADTYLKFDLGALPPNVTAGNVAKANLRLYVDFVVSPGSFDVYQAAGPWSEGTLTAGNAPGIVGTPINQSPISVTKALQYIDIDITSAFANGPPSNGLVLVPSKGSAIFASFDSKENPLTSHDPELSVSVNDASSTQLQQEIKRATQAENTISTNLATETTRATGAENGLSSGLNAEIARAKGAEGALGTNVANETARATGAETGITNALNGEIANRVAGDTKALGAATTYTDAGVANEAVQRAAADNTLQNSLAGLQSSLSGYAQLGVSNKFAARQVINGDLSANNVNAGGLLTANGALLPAIQQATPTQGFPSNPFDLAASVSDGTNSQNDTFRWQAVPVNNGTPNFAAQLNLLFGGGVTPVQTGFSFNSDGTQNFAANQKFVGDGSGLRGVNAVSANVANTAGLANNSLALGGAPSGSFAQTAVSNNFTASQTLTGNLQIAGAGNGIVFADGTRQTTAAAGTASAIPPGFTILGSSATAPPGFSPSAVIHTGNAWISESPIPTPRAGLGAVGLGGKVYAMGGYSAGTPLATNEIYFPSTNTWWNTSEENVTPMPTARGYLALATANGKIYALGGAAVSSQGAVSAAGIEQSLVPLNVVEVYDPATNSWSTAAPMPTARYGLAACTLNGKIYAVGGSQGLFGQLNTVEVYDPATNSWSTAAPMPFARQGLALAAVNNKIYAFGGGGDLGLPSGPGPSQDTQSYDPSTDSWVSFGRLLPTGAEYLAAAVQNGIIYAFGGDPGPFGALNAVQAYDPPSNIWVAQAPMPTARGYLAAAATEDGFIYVIGGHQGLFDAPYLPLPITGGTFLGNIEQYSPPVNLYTFTKN